VAGSYGRGGVIIDSQDVDPPVGDQGWTTVKTVILRFQAGYTPSGHFPVFSNRQYVDGKFFNTVVGYDAAVCVQRYEPWVVETYNTSIVPPSTFRIVEKGDGSNSSSSSGNIRGVPIANTGYLNATGKGPAFTVAHVNSINQMVKDSSSGDIFYTPSLTVGPVVPPCTTFLLTLTYSAGRFFHQWHWTSGIHRTLPGPARRCPRTGRCG